MTDEQQLEWNRLVAIAYRPVTQSSYNYIEVNRDIIQSVGSNLTAIDELKAEVRELRLKIKNIVTQSAEVHQEAMDAYNIVEGMK